MKSVGGRARALVLLVLFSSSRAFAQTDDAPLPEPPPPPPAPVGPSQEPLPAVAPSPSSSPSPSPSPSSTATPRRSVPPASTASATRLGVDDPERTWYGWQLLINDFVALGTLGVAAAVGVKGTNAIAVIVPVAIVYDLGSPTIHWLHGRKGIAGASFGVRAGVPFVGVLLGAAAGGCGRADSSSAKACRSQAAGYGALAGFAAATAIDATFFAFDAPKTETLRSGVRWAPLAVPAEGGATFGVVGTF